jgi:hypothetical protein
MCFYETQELLGEQRKASHVMYLQDAPDKKTIKVKAEPNLPESVQFDKGPPGHCKGPLEASERYLCPAGPHKGN